METPIPRPPPRSLLLVDDNPADRDALRLAFERHDCADALVAVENAVQLFRYLVDPGHPRPQLILLDFIMPVFDGRFVLEQLRADPALGRLPVLIISDLERQPLPGSPSWTRKPTTWNGYVRAARLLLRWLERRGRGQAVQGR